MAEQDLAAREMCRKTIKAYDSGEHKYSVQVRNLITEIGRDWVDNSCYKLLFECSDLPVSSEDALIKLTITDLGQPSLVIIRKLLLENHLKCQIISDKKEKSNKNNTAEVSKDQLIAQEKLIDSFINSAPLLNNTGESSKSIELLGCARDILKTCLDNQLGRLEGHLEIVSSEEAHPSNTPHKSIRDQDPEIINIRSQSIQPTFKFEKSALGAMLPDFLRQMEDANNKLTEASGSAKSKGAVPQGFGFEIDDENESVQQVIEMELGLGVLEEQKDAKEEEFIKLAK